jgi:hypothetical protein
MLEVGIAARLFADAEEVDGAGLLVDVEDLGDVAFAVRDLVLELAGGEVVEIEIAPVVALAEPEDLVRGGQVVPVDLAVAALEELGRGLGPSLRELRRCGVGDAEPLLLVVARGGDEGEMLGVGTPLDVVPGVAFAGDVVADGAAVLVGRHLEARCLLCVDVDDHALDHGDVFVADEWILPGL